MIMPLANILKQSGCEIATDNEITATGRRSKKKIVIYPAMWVEPYVKENKVINNPLVDHGIFMSITKLEGGALC